MALLTINLQVDRNHCEILPLVKNLLVMGEGFIHLLMVTEVRLLSLTNIAAIDSKIHLDLQ